MNIRIYFQRFTILTIFLFLLANFSLAQKNFPEPREESLLNNLKVLIWNQPNTKKVTVKIRVHSGSAFDPQDKMGAMYLLGQILFPEDGIRKFFEDELDGSLEVINTYDYIQINATAKSDEFVTLLETLAPAVSNPDIDKEKTALIKEIHLAKLKELEKDAGYIADQAIAERLLGDFPYGRPLLGTTESVNTIDFADLIFTEQRFFNADNATIAIIGDVKTDFAYRAARRLFGAWKKGDNKVPATFRIPEEPSEAPLIINVDGQNVIEDRYAINAKSRRDKDYFATEILTRILDERFKKHSKEKGLDQANVKNNSHLLRGHIVFVKKFNTGQIPDNKLESEANSTEKTSRPPQIITKLFTEAITAGEFNKAKNLFLAEINNKDTAEMFLDLDTFKLKSVKNEMEKINSVNLADVNRLAVALSKNKIANVSVSPVETEMIPDAVLKKDPDDPKK
jgi:predicted Zn-dependent peptidase